MTGIVMVFFLTACGGGGSGAEQDSPPPQSKAFTEITQIMLAEDENDLPMDIAEEKLEYDADNNPSAFDSLLPQT